MEASDAGLGEGEGDASPTASAQTVVNAATGIDEPTRLAIETGASVAPPDTAGVSVCATAIATSLRRPGPTVNEAWAGQAISSVVSDLDVTGPTIVLCHSGPGPETPVGPISTNPAIGCRRIRANSADRL